jgi:hypothetical protein
LVEHCRFFLKSSSNLGRAWRPEIDEKSRVLALFVPHPVIIYSCHRRPNKRPIQPLHQNRVRSHEMISLPKNIATYWCREVRLRALKPSSKYRVMMRRASLVPRDNYRSISGEKFWSADCWLESRPLPLRLRLKARHARENSMCSSI